MTLLRLEGVTAYYGHLEALEELSLEVARGEILAVIGANGAGKSTLLSLISGELRPKEGRVIFDDVDVTRHPPHQRVREGISLVPEGRHLFGNLSVEENLLVGSASKRRGAWNLDAVYELFPIVKARRKHRAAFLSGGEQQAVAIGRALMSNPTLLLLDEVSLGLAPVVVRNLYVGLRRISADGTSLLIVEQNITEALNIADYVVCLLEGRIVLSDVPAALDQAMLSAAYFGHSLTTETPPKPQMTQGISDGLD
ncbi:MAG: ABC transporter ATP-binding protein [Acidimicrobiales bacterium]|jgi:branched-chain amino acid transport system ATP-binding protein